MLYERLHVILSGEQMLDHFSGPYRAIGPLSVCACLVVRTITF